jgi:hypothetical protein
VEVIPKPTEGDIPFNAPVRRTLGPGERLTATFSPEQRTTTFHVPAVGASKHPEMRYVVYTDDTKRFDAAVPPTDIDDMGVTFVPALSFNREMRIRIENLSGSTTRPVAVQPVGWEEAKTV